MNYLAILKDSFREALDSKVIYVMAGLSLLVTLVVGSMSFRPLPAEDLMRSLAGGRVFGMGDVLDPDRSNHGRPRDDEEDLARQGAEETKKGPAAKKERRRRPGDFEFQGVEVVRGAADSPDSDYKVTIRKAYADRDEAEKVPRAPAEALEVLKNQFAPYEEFGLLRIADVRLAGRDNPFPGKATDPSENDVYFEVTTQPTPETRRLWPHEPSLFFGALPLGVQGVPLGFQLFFISALVVQIGSWVAILAGIIITAFFIPNMLRKGTVDLLLVKPIQRWAILVYKYIGGLTFIFLNTTVAIVGIWLALGLRSGIWANSFLLMIPILTFFFAILYAVSTLFAVLTRSAVVAILMTCGAWFLFFVVGAVYNVFDVRAKEEERRQLPAEQRWSQSGFGSAVKAIHFVLPRTSDLSHLGQQLLLSDFLTGKLGDAARLDRTSITWGESLTVSLVFIALMLGLSSWWFATKDF